MVEVQSSTIVLKETSQQICMLFFIFVIVIFKNDYKLCLYKLFLYKKVLLLWEMVMFMIYGLFTKSEVKMAGYWQSFFACLWTETNCVKNSPLRVVFSNLFSVCEYRDETLVTRV